MEPCLVTERDEIPTHNNVSEPQKMVCQVKEDRHERLPTVGSYLCQYVQERRSVEGGSRSVVD